MGNLPDYPRTIAVVNQSDPNNDTIYAAVGTYKVYKSTDGGNSFASVSGGLMINAEYKNISISPANSNYLYVKLNNSTIANPIYTHDGGITWSQPVSLDEGGLSFREGGSFVGLPVAPHPTNPNVALLITSGTIHRTTNGGSTWVYSGEGYLGGRRAGTTSAYFDPNNSNRMIFFLVDEGPIITEDGGETWRFLNVPKYNYSRNTFVGSVDPNNQNIIIAAVGSYASQVIIRTINGGSNESDWSVAHTPNVPDRFYFIGFNPKDSNYVYASTRSDSWISKDNGRTWTSFPGKSIKTIDPKDGKVIYALQQGTEGGQSKLWRSNDKGETWAEWATNPFWGAEFMDIDPNNNSYLYVGQGFQYIDENQPSGLYFFNGAQWIEIGKSNGIPIDSSFGRNSFNVHVVRVDPNNSNTLYALIKASKEDGHREDFLYRSINRGQTWEDMRYNLSGFSYPFSLAINPYNGNLYLNTAHGNYVLVNSSQSSSSSASASPPVGSGYVSDSIISSSSSQSSLFATTTFATSTNTNIILTQSSSSSFRSSTVSEQPITQTRIVKQQPRKSYNLFFSKPINFKQTSNDVVIIQNKLKYLGFFPKTVDASGYFGNITKQSIKNYQKAKGLPVNGQADQTTLMAISQKEFTTINKPIKEMNESELQVKIFEIVSRMNNLLERKLNNQPRNKP